MTAPVERLLRIGAALTAMTLLAAAPAPATAKTSAACVDHLTSTISPGYSFIPSSGTDTTNGEPGTIACVGTIAGARITGPGSAGFDMAYTRATCASVTGTGTFRATIPTTAASQHLVGALTVHATALALRVDVEFPGIRYSGIGVTIPLQGDCLLKPLRKAMTSDIGSLTSLQSLHSQHR